MTVQLAKVTEPFDQIRNKPTYGEDETLEETRKAGGTEDGRSADSVWQVWTCEGRKLHLKMSLFPFKPAEFSNSFAQERLLGAWNRSDWCSAQHLIAFSCAKTTFSAMHRKYSKPLFIKGLFPLTTPHPAASVLPGRTLPTCLICL